MSNPRVSISIYKTEQKESIIGIQLEGEATILTKKSDEKEIKNAYETYYGRAGSGPDMQSYINDPTWLYVKIVPEQMYYFDTRFFGEVRQIVPMDKIK